MVITYYYYYYLIMLFKLLLFLLLCVSIDGWYGGGDPEHVSAAMATGAVSIEQASSDHTVTGLASISAQSRRKPL